MDASFGKIISCGQRQLENPERPKGLLAYQSHYLCADSRWWPLPCSSTLRGLARGARGATQASMPVTASSSQRNPLPLPGRVWVHPTKERTLAPTSEPVLEPSRACTEGLKGLGLAPSPRFFTVFNRKERVVWRPRLRRGSEFANNRFMSGLRSRLLWGPRHTRLPSAADLPTTW